MSINYDYYRIFYYVARYKSFTQAANVLMNSQPNITRAIKNLEQEIGCTLFIRTNRTVQLTPEGEALYRHVSIAFEQLQAGEEEIAKGKGLEGGILRIAATEVALRTFLLPVLKFFELRLKMHIPLFKQTGLPTTDGGSCGACSCRQSCQHTGQNAQIIICCSSSSSQPCSSCRKQND